MSDRIPQPPREPRHPPTAPEAQPLLLSKETLTDLDAPRAEETVKGGGGKTYTCLTGIPPVQ
jgi:hypothetical protein